MNNYHPSDTKGLIRSSKLKIDNFSLHFRHSMEEDSRSNKLKLKSTPYKYKLEDSSVKLVKQLRERQKNTISAIC